MDGCDDIQRWVPVLLEADLKIQEFCQTDCEDELRRLNVTQRAELAQAV
jgi:hypothetical protein